ncbi:hypothetical protein Hanom_Chr16g01516421 [Helianthus anomalus]
MVLSEPGEDEENFLVNRAETKTILMIEEGFCVSRKKRSGVNKKRRTVLREQKEEDDLCDQTYLLCVSQA